MTFLFWLSVIAVIYAYIGYPLTMYLWAKHKPTPHKFDESHEPTITVIIAAANEEERIQDKLDNVFATEYPHEKMQVIVALDGPTDGTKDVVKDYIDDYETDEYNLMVVEIEKGGKEAAQYEAIQFAKNEICVFTDAATILQPDAFHKLTRHFSDIDIGAVDGMSQIISDGHSNEGLYLQYENKIREWNSATCGVVAMGGCLFAIKSTLLEYSNTEGYQGFEPDLQSDFRSALVCKTFLHRAILDREAVATFKDGKPKKEFARKHRTIVRGINVFMHNLHLLVPANYGLFSYAFFCNKLLKWMVPLFMLIAYISANALSGTSAFWFFVNMSQQAFYITALIGYLGLTDNKYVKIIGFFVVTNLAIAKAWYSYLKGERFVFWEPTKR